VTRAHVLRQAEYRALVDAHIMFKDMSVDKYLLAAGIAADWPKVGFRSHSAPEIEAANMLANPV
jgi:hypothetical protein